MNQSSINRTFFIHICKYLGIALVSGSIVHALTLGGDIAWYVLLIVIGIMLTVTGHFFERTPGVSIASFIAMTTLISFGTGMLSGGVQHFFDSPEYGALFIPLGASITYLAIGLKEHYGQLSASRMAYTVLVALLVWFVLQYVGEMVHVEGLH